MRDRGERVVREAAEVVRWYRKGWKEASEESEVRWFSGLRSGAEAEVSRSAGGGRTRDERRLGGSKGG